MSDADLAWLVPVLNRPHRVQPLLDAIEATTPNAQVVFVMDTDDPAEHAAVREAETSLQVVPLVKDGGYSAKINEAAKVTDRPLLLIGADDLEPHPGWLEAAEAKLSDEVQVVGVNDLIDRGRDHATHFLMTREYAQRPTIDKKRGPLFEGYAHWWCDDELIGTARFRRAYAYAEDAHIKHLHPMNGGAEDDAVYRKGRSKWRQDRRMFHRRSRLWTT